MRLGDATTVFATAVAVLFLGLAQGVGHAALPSLPVPFIMEVILKPWFVQHPLFCTVAYTPPGHLLGNCLYVKCTSKGVSYMKLYVFNKDLLYEFKGGQWTLLKEIPNSEKVDQYFPVPFRQERGYKIFDKPEALLHFDGLYKQRRVHDSPVDAIEWEVDVNVTALGETYGCANKIVFTRESNASEFCHAKGPPRRSCPPVPFDADINCGEEKRILIFVPNYAVKLDGSVIEELANITETTEISSNESPTEQAPTKALSTGLVACMVIFPIVIIGISFGFLYWHYKTRGARKELTRPVGWNRGTVCESDDWQ